MTDNPVTRPPLTVADARERVMEEVRFAIRHSDGADDVSVALTAFEAAIRAEEHATVVEALFKWVGRPE